MPQTREHLEILSLLGIDDGMIVFTKRDQVDEELFELVLEDVKEQLTEFGLSDMSMFEVDSVSGRGIDELRESVKDWLKEKEETPSIPSFRLPIDQVFTVKGQGAIVRGTVYDGQVTEGDEVKVLPSGKRVRIRQIQRHNEQKESAKRGQRAAINLGGVSYEELKRGDVLVSDDYFSVSDRLDVVLFPLSQIDHPIKQRQPVKVHIGTSEVMGRIIFYDRNEIPPKTGEEEVYCQLELEEEIVVARGDRFILRRPTPVETLGGGWVIEAEADRHRFGQDTIKELQRKKEGSPEERIEAVLRERRMLSLDSIGRLTSLSKEEVQASMEDLYQVDGDLYTHQSIFTELKEEILKQVQAYQEDYPMRGGLNKAEVTSKLSTFEEALIDLALEDLEGEERLTVDRQFLRIHGLNPSLPKSWEKRLVGVEEALRAQGLEVGWWNDLFEGTNIPEEIKQDFRHYLLDQERAFVFERDRLISAQAVMGAKGKLRQELSGDVFSLQEVRDILGLTRKNLIPLLELFDELGFTERVENDRRWVE